MFKRVASLIVGLGLLVGCQAQTFEPQEGQDLTARVGGPSYYMATLSSDQVTMDAFAVNQPFTMCVDDTMSATCPVDFLDFVYSGLDERTTAEFAEEFATGYGVAHGWTERIQLSDGSYRTVLYVLDAWSNVGHTGLDSLALYDVSPLDIACVRAPCPTHGADLANHDKFVYLHGLYFDGDVQNAIEDVPGERLLMAGTIVENDGTPEKRPETLEGRYLFVHTYYVQLQPL